MILDHFVIDRWYFSELKRSRYFILDIIFSDLCNSLPVDCVKAPECESDEHADGESEAGEEEILQAHQGPLDRIPPAADEVVDLRVEVVMS